MARKGGNPNLPHFKKGYDPRRNLNGPPKKLPDLNKLLAAVLGDEETPNSGWQKIIEAVKKKAAKGDVRAAEMLMDRGYGKPKQTIEQSGSLEMRVPKIEIYSELPESLGVPPLEIQPCNKTPDQEA